MAEIGTPRVAIGTYLSNRGTVALQQMFGLFANLITLVMECADTDMQFGEWLGIVQSITAEAELHGAVLLGIAAALIFAVAQAVTGY